MGGATVIRGRVVRDGAPVARAYVRLLDRGGDYTGEARTLDDGAFLFNAAAGDWRPVVFGNGIERAEHPVSVAAGAETTLEIAV